MVEDIKQFNIPVSVIGYCEVNKAEEKLSAPQGNGITIIPDARDI